VNKEFTKESFASLVDAKFLKHSILEGLVYDKNTSYTSSSNSSFAIEILPSADTVIDNGI